MSNLSGSGTLRGSLSRGGGTPSDVYWDDILNKPDFAAVATSGSYNDLLDKPTIPPAPTVMTGATAQTNGAAGYAPQPLAGDQDKFLNGSGVWVTPPSNSINYSTNEQLIGTWIDGKPLYKRTFYYDNQSGLVSGNNKIIQLDSAINVTKLDGFLVASDTNQRWILPYSKGSSTTSIIITNDHFINIYITDDSWSSTRKIYITIEYTKTTD